jgi:hypothetical protein
LCDCAGCLTRSAILVFILKNDCLQFFGICFVRGNRIKLNLFPGDRLA